MSKTFLDRLVGYSIILLQLEAIINEFFSTDVDENEHIIKNFREEYDL